MLKKSLAILMFLTQISVSVVSSAVSIDPSSVRVQPTDIIQELNLVRQKLIRWVNFLERKSLPIFPDSELNTVALTSKSRVYIKYRQLIKKIPLDISQQGCLINPLNPASTSAPALAATRINVCVNVLQLSSLLTPNNYKKELFKLVATEYASILSLYVTTPHKLTLATASSIQDLIVQTYFQSREIDVHYFDNLEWHKNNLQRLLATENINVIDLESAIRNFAVEAKNLQLNEMISLGQSALSRSQRALLQSSRLRMLNWEQSLCERRDGHGCRFYMNEAYGIDPVTKAPNTLVSMLRFASIMQQARPYESDLINVNSMVTRTASVKGIKLSCSIIISIIEKIIADGRSEISNYYEIK